MYESKCVSQRHLSYAHAVKKADKEDKAKLLDKVDAFIFDCDGENPYMQIMDNVCITEPLFLNKVGALSMRVHL